MRTRMLPCVALFAASFAGPGCSNDSGTNPSPDGGTQPCAEGEPLQFNIEEGDQNNYFRNYFYRQGPMAAHLITESGTSSRILFAFPANNTGAGIWFENAGTAVKIDVADVETLGCVARPDGMRGMSAHLRSDAKSLKVHGAVLGNIRTLRQYTYNKFSYDGPQPIPHEVAPKVEAGPPVILRRTTTTGKNHVELDLLPENGTTIAVNGADITFNAGSSGEIRVLATALADDPPLTPFAATDLVNEQAANRPRDLQALSFLTYKEKMLAGSWRFLTYFGRDTLITVSLLMPALRAPVIEGALGSVLERLSPAGEVAHEEAIGDFAALQNSQLKPPPADLETPIYDYKMTDETVLLAPVVAMYLLDAQGQKDDPGRAQRFLSMKTSAGETYAAALARNLAFVMREAQAYADHPSATTLVKIKDTVNGAPNNVGNWRDSQKGLGGGRFAFDIDAALVPAALQGAARLYGLPELGDSAAAQTADRLANAWKSSADYFKVTVPLATAKKQASDYATAQHIDPKPATDALIKDMTYYALSLDASGRPVPVMHTDSAFALFFTDPTPDYLNTAADDLVRPFPAGLLTQVGEVVANPAFAADPNVQSQFTPLDYHGTTVWSWEQAMLAAGLKRQRARTDLPQATLDALKNAETQLWNVITAMNDKSTGELWTWVPKDGQVAYAPYIVPGGGNESNAAQLWSTVYLAVQKP